MKKNIMSFVFVCFMSSLFCPSIIGSNCSNSVNPKNEILSYDLKECAVAPPTVTSPIYYCQGSTAVPLAATPSPGNTLLWYTTSSGGIGNPIAPTPSTAVVGSTSYYVSETDGVTESARFQIVVNVVANNGATILNFRCDPSQVLPADRYSSVMFDWSNNPLISNTYNYTYTIQGGSPVSGTTGVSHQQVFGMSPGQSATLTLSSATHPCVPPQTITCTVPCLTTTTPTFNQISPVCQGTTAPSLPSSSNEGITGTWSPAMINSSVPGTVAYTFTPNPVAYPCTTTQTMSVTVNPKATPIFNSIPSAVCQNATAPILPLNSDNTIPISGTWSPATVNTAVLGPTPYTFTPNPGQCVVNPTTTFMITVNPNITPNFAAIPPICSGTIAPVLGNTSPNGITGTWSPSVINNTNSGSYTFTPDANQCATTQTLNVTVMSRTVPNFAAIPSFCSGATAPTLGTTSPNGVSGTWLPSTIDNKVSGSYVFTPNSNECAVTQTLNITVTPQFSPGFGSFAICSGSVPPNLNTTSPNGTTGTWSPAVIDNMTSGSYVFTPDSGQCSGSQTIDVTVVPSDTLVDFQWTVSKAFEENKVITIEAVAVGGDYLYQLDDGPFQSSPVFENVSSGMHSVTVIEQNGCSSPITKTDILVVNYPRYFTPNNDGYNDVWNIFDLSNQSASVIHIFDRYGKLLKEIRPGGSGWNGTFNGRPLPADDYWFVIHYTEDDISKEFKSHFSLKR